MLQLCAVVRLDKYACTEFEAEGAEDIYLTARYF